MYQPYPAGGQQTQSRPAPPPSILAAVKVMYAGAVLSAAAVVVTIVSTSSLRAAIHKAHPLLGAARLHSAVTFDVVTGVIVGVGGIAIWLWMAAANKAGESRARNIASVIFGLNTLAVLIDVTRPDSLLGELMTIVIWVVGLAAIILLWQRASRHYYDASARTS